MIKKLVLVAGFLAFQGAVAMSPAETEVDERVNKILIDYGYRAVAAWHPDWTEQVKKSIERLTQGLIERGSLSEQNKEKEKWLKAARR